MHSTGAWLQGRMSFGHAVGPQWASQLPHSSAASHITLEYGVEVASIQSHASHTATAGLSGEQAPVSHAQLQPTADAALHQSDTSPQDAAAALSLSAPAVQGQHCQQSKGPAAARSVTGQEEDAEPSTSAGQGDTSSCGSQWPVTVNLSNGRSYGADLVISAIGVDPNTGWLPDDIRRDADDGGILVDKYA